MCIRHTNWTGSLTAECLGLAGHMHRNSALWGLERDVDKEEFGTPGPLRCVTLKGGMPRGNGGEEAASHQERLTPTARMSNLSLLSPTTSIL